MPLTKDKTTANVSPVTSSPRSSKKRGFETNIPKRLFMYWHQGWNNAPDIVKRCAATWQKHNSGWDINLLDAATIREKIELPPAVKTLKLPLPALSDVIRLCLLKKYGGVWADATLWCVRPLDDWINSVCAPSGFFAYDKPGPGRPISSWFLAAGRDCRIIDLWHSAALQLLAKTQAYARFRWVFENKEKNWLLKAISNLCMSYILLRFRYDHLLITSSEDPKDDNYFWFHYLFGRLLDQNSEFHQLWISTPKISADDPQLLRCAGLLKPATEHIDFIIKNKVSNVHKLSRRESIPDEIAGTVLDALYHSGEGP